MSRQFCDMPRSCDLRRIRATYAVREEGRCGLTHSQLEGERMMIGLDAYATRFILS